MKTLFGFLLAGVLTQGSVSAQFFFLTENNRDGTLQWTNQLCTTMPVYSIERADSVTGPYSPIASVTNQTTFTLSDPVPNGSTAFYQVAWTSDEPVVLDYQYDEHGVGIPSVYGQVTLNFASMSASWFFEEDPDFNTSPHPLGAGFGPIGFTSDLQTWIVILRPTFDDTIYLAGGLRSLPTPTGCEYTTYTGFVYHLNFVGTDEIGEFIASRP